MRGPEEVEANSALWVSKTARPDLAALYVLYVRSGDAWQCEGCLEVVG
jgi:hypothetical protein